MQAGQGASAGSLPLAHIHDDRVSITDQDEDDEEDV